MKAMDHRLRHLLGIFARAGRAQDGRPGTEALRKASGLASWVLSPSYRFERSANTMDRLVGAAATLLNLERQQLEAWLMGEDEPVIAAMLQQEHDLIQCTVCHDWFGSAEIASGGKMVRRCKRCHRQRSLASNPRGKGHLFSRALVTSLAALRAQNPQLAANVEHASGVRDDKLRLIDVLTAVDPPLGQAVNAVLLSGETITGPRVERASLGAIKAEQVSQRIRAAIGLTKGALVQVVLLVVLAAAAQADSHADPKRHPTTAVVKRRRKKGERGHANGPRRSPNTRAAIRGELTRRGVGSSRAAHLSLVPAGSPPCSSSPEPGPAGTLSFRSARLGAA